MWVCVPLHGDASEHEEDFGVEIRIRVGEIRCLQLTWFGGSRSDVNFGFHPPTRGGWGRLDQDVSFMLPRAEDVVE